MKRSVSKSFILTLHPNPEQVIADKLNAVALRYVAVGGGNNQSRNALPPDEFGKQAGGIGTNAEEGREILANAKMITADTLADAACKAVEATRPGVAPKGGYPHEHFD